ncbi:MAG TPA: efflux RND transporter permease subunit [Stenomitos sp.]
MVEPTRKKALRERFNISQLAIEFPWLSISFWIAVTVAGILAFSSLKYALFPDITFPVVVVNASAPLKTALDTERQLTNPIEQQLKSLERLDESRSSSYPGQSVVSLSFAVGTNLENVSRQVETSLKNLKWPAGATFKVIPLNLNESAVVSYAIQSSSQNLADLAKLAKDKIVPAISQIPGVLKVELLGEPLKTPLSLSSASDALGQGATLVRFKGQDALAFQVIKRGDANTLDVVSKVEAEIETLKSTLSGVQLTLAATQAEYIREATHATIDALMLAVVLSVLVIYPFLWNLRATLITALAIPISLLGTFIVMAMFGFNLETITLLALALVIGIIVDDAIVDVENITRHIENGETPRRASIIATQEIGVTVSAATLTIVAVFLPVGLMGGVVGQFFKPFGITVSAAVLASLFVARTLSPLLASRWLKPKTARRRESKESGFTQGYRHLLAWSLHHRGMVLGLAVLSLAMGLGLIPLIPKGFIPTLDRGEFNITYTAPLPTIPKELSSASGLSEMPSVSPVAGASHSPASADLQKSLATAKKGSLSPETVEALRQAQAASAFNPLHDSLQVAKSLDDFVRKSPQVKDVFTIVGSRQGEPNKGRLYVKLKSDRTVKTAEVQNQLRDSLPQIPGVTTSIEDIQFVDTGGDKPLKLALLGDNLEELNRTANQLKQRLEKQPGFADVTSSATANQPGTILEIQHDNTRRTAYVGANLGQGATLGNSTERMVKEAKAVLPAGITLDLGGDSARSSEILSSFGTTLGLSVLCILVVLALLFQSWSDPLVIIFSLPLSIVGAMLGLLLTGSDFGMISLIGIIFLIGLINKNAILIVDYINQLRKSGLNQTEAILQAGPVRLRPILMTTASTILGMLPLALGLGAGAELRAPMAVAIIGGLITSTLLSLIVVPVVYASLDDLRNRFSKNKRFV